MIKNFEPRLYQQTIFATSMNYNTLVVLPTGMGKTNVAVMLAAHRLKQHPESKILILAPTKPLVEQHKRAFLKFLDLNEEDVTVFTGHVQPDKRAELWKNCKIIFSTPQTIENDLINKRFDVKDVSLLVVDEAHRATGDYAYVFIAKQFDRYARMGKILALTASPGSDMEKINEVCENLFVEQIEVRTDKDPDVKPYIQKVDIEWVKVDLPETFKEVQKYLKDCSKSKLAEIARYGYVNSQQVQMMSKTEMLGVQGSLQGQLAKGDRSLEVLKSLSLMAEVMKVQHALELLETQGVHALNLYMEQIMQDSYKTKVKAVINLARDINFRSAYIKAKSLAEKGLEHPKLLQLKRIIAEEIRNNPDSKIIVFNQFRDSISKINDELSMIPGVVSTTFVGQAKKRGTGLSQKQQIEIMKDFSDGKYNVVCMSSVGEEGLDIPAVDTVIFYEPVPSAIRTIQRRGRTGRLEKGRVIMLATKDTRDMGYKWSAHHKEKRMYRVLEDLKKKFSFKHPKLQDYAKKESHSDIKIFADHREKGSGVIKALIDKEVDLRLSALSNADYLLSSDVGVEFKNAADFVNSILDGRLLAQIKDLKKNFSKPLLLIEGEDVYSVRNIHPNAIRGMLATIMINFQVPVIFTKDPSESAAFLLSIARREQEEKKDFSLHGSRRLQSLQDQQEYVVEALPSVGPDLAKKLLKHFGSIKGIANADIKDLMELEGVGKVIAGKIKDVLSASYS